MTRREKMLDSIDSAALVAFARDLVRIPSENPPGDENGVAMKILDRLKNLGLKTEIVEAEPGRPNLIASLEGDPGGPTLLFNGHTDVVPAGSGWEVDPYGGIIKDGRLYGRGACDMKGGLAAILAVAEVFQKAGIRPRGRLLYSIVVDEETGGQKGTGYLVENQILKADMAVVAEPSDFTMSIAEPGIVWVELVTHGTQTHTINRKNAINPVEKMAKAIVAFDGLREDLNRLEHDFHGYPILTVNVIQGGHKTNIIPDRCRASVDFRFPPGIGMTPKEAIERVEATLRALRQEDGEMKIEAAYKVVAHPFEQSEEIDIVKRVKEATKELSGKYPEWWRRGKKTMIPVDDSDVYHLWVKGGIPSIYFGPGKLEQAHAANEYIDIEDIPKAAKIYTLIALRVLTDLK